MQRLFKMVPEVVFCFDGDDAGRRAAWRALESTLPVMQDGKQARFLFLPQGEDPDSMVRQEGKEAFLKRIQSEALSLDNFLFRELIDGLDLQTMDGRARLTKLAQPYLNKLPESIFKKLVLQKMSEMTGLDSDMLAAHLHDEPEPAPTSKPAMEQPMYDHSHPPVDYYDQPATPEYYDHYPIQESFEPQQKKKSYYKGGFNKSGFNKAGFQPKPKAPPAPIKVGHSIYAIRHLLCNPQLAVKVENIELLEQDESLDTQLLIELIKVLKQSPKLSTIALIAQWQGTSNGERLQQVATLELGHQPDDGEFWEAISRIREKVQQLKTKATTNNLLQSLASKKPGQFDPAERKEYEAFLKKLQERVSSTKNN